MEYSFIIRRAQVSDAADIKQIMKFAFEKYASDAGITSNVEALFESCEQIEEDIRNKYVYIALVDGMAVGSLRVEVNEDKTAYLTRFGVRSGFGNMGIGKSLMSLVDKLMIEKGVEQLKLHTASTYKELIRFYYGRGFYIDSTSKDRGYIRALLVKKYK